MNCHYYLIVEPLLLLGYHDDVNVQPSSSAVVKTKLKEYKVSFFTNTNQLYMIRIDIPNVVDKTLQQKELETIQTIKEHILSVLRLTYDHDVSLFPRPLSAQEIELMSNEILNVHKCGGLKFSPTNQLHLIADA